MCLCQKRNVSYGGHSLKESKSEKKLLIDYSNMHTTVDAYRIFDSWKWRTNTFAVLRPRRLINSAGNQIDRAKCITLHQSSSNRNGLRQQRATADSSPRRCSDSLNEEGCTGKLNCTAKGEHYKTPVLSSGNSGRQACRRRSLLYQWARAKRG